jgi:hypothetical protein
MMRVFQTSANALNSATTERAARAAAVTFRGERSAAEQDGAQHKNESAERIERCINPGHWIRSPGILKW